MESRSWIAAAQVAAVQAVICRQIGYRQLRYLLFTDRIDSVAINTHRNDVSYYHVTHFQTLNVDMEALIDGQLKPSLSDRSRLLPSVASEVELFIPRPLNNNLSILV